MNLQSFFKAKNIYIVKKSCAHEFSITCLLMWLQKKEISPICKI